MAIAVPSFDNFLNSNALRSHLNQFQSSLQLARATSVSKSTEVVLCTSSNGTSCSGSNDWHNGWIIFTDLNGNTVPNLGSGNCADNEDCLLKVVEGFSTQTTLTGNSDTVSFNNLGEYQSGGNLFRLCRADAQSTGDTDKSRSISLSASGSTTVILGASPCP